MAAIRTIDSTQIPALTTASVSDITATSAILGGNIADEDVRQTTDRGIELLGLSANIGEEVFGE